MLSGFRLLSGPVCHKFRLDLRHRVREAKGRGDSGEELRLESEWLFPSGVQAIAITEVTVQVVGLRFGITGIYS